MKRNCRALTRNRPQEILSKDIHSKSLKDADSLHTDQHDANVISHVVNSSDEAGQENDKAGDNLYDGDNSYDEPAKGVSENLEIFSTKKEDK